MIFIFDDARGEPGNFREPERKNLPTGWALFTIISKKLNHFSTIYSLIIALDPDRIRTPTGLWCGARHPMPAPSASLALNSQ
jgi:hypothetical protein